MAKDFHWKKHKYSVINFSHKKYLGEYRIYNSMKARCYNPVVDSFKTHGARGIKVCDRWLDREKGFINFYTDMGARPKEPNGRHYQLDRIDVNGDYCPENCRWVTAKQQQQNRRNNKFSYLFNEKMCLSEICRLLHLNRTTVTEAIRMRGKTAEEAIINGILIRYKEAAHVC